MIHETLCLSPGSAASVTTHGLTARVNLLTFGAIELEPGMTGAEIVRACRPREVRPTTVGQIVNALVAHPIGTWVILEGDVSGAIARAEGVYQEWSAAFHDHPRLSVVMEATSETVTVRLERKEA